MNNHNFEIGKVDVAMAALSKLPEDERGKIMEGLREIVKMYVGKEATSPSVVKFRWFGDIDLLN